MTDKQFEAQVHKTLDALKGKERDAKIKMLKSTYRDRIDHINLILKSYE